MTSVKETEFDTNFFKLNPFENITEELIHQGTVLLQQNNDYTAATVSDQLHNTRSSSFLNFCTSKSASILRSVPLVRHLIGPPNETAATINKLIAQQKAATSYQEWYDTSSQLDELIGNNIWKSVPESTLFDYELVSSRLNELRQTRKNKDYHKLLYLIRTTWTRNMANMDNINLYRHSSVGTKTLIEDYIEECEKCLSIFANGESGLDDSYTLGMLMQTRKNYGRVAITMSGGGCFGVLETGVFATLLEMDLLPKIVSGSSSGSILSSIICSKTSPEILELLGTLAERKFEIFEKDDNPESFLSCLGRLLKYGTWFDNVYLQNTMKEFLGDLTFREAYNRTGRILNITVSPASVYEQPTLLNYLTAPNVLIWSAVCASCSLPGVFPSSTIYEKHLPSGMIQEWSNPLVKFVDGSVNADLPITRLSEMFNVNHVIAVQVNPHVAPLLKMSIQCVGGEIENEYSAKLKQMLNHAYSLVTTEASHYLEVLSELGIATNICTKLRQVLSQRYSGDITILPDIRLTEMNKLLANPTPDFIWDSIVRGARATWPKLSIIKNHCSIEFSLDKSITSIRSRLITSSRKSFTHIPIALIESDRRKFCSDHMYSMKRKDRHRSESLNLGSMGEGSLRKKSSAPDLKRGPSYSSTFGGSYRSYLGHSVKTQNAKSHYSKNSLPPSPTHQRNSFDANDYQSFRNTRKSLPSSYTNISDFKLRPQSSSAISFASNLNNYNLDGRNGDNKTRSKTQGAGAGSCEVITIGDMNRILIGTMDDDFCDTDQAEQEENTQEGTATLSVETIKTNNEVNAENEFSPHKVIITQNSSENVSEKGSPELGTLNSGFDRYSGFSYYADSALDPDDPANM